MHSLWSRVITDWKVWNWFAKLHSRETALEDEPRPAFSSVFDGEAVK